MVPPGWMIEELEKQRQQRDERERARLWIDLPEPLPVTEHPRPESPRGPFVIELW
jgi:hypothetical protein